MKRDAGPTFAGAFRAYCCRPDGRLLWALEAYNDVTDQGLADLLGAGFAAGAQRSWYAGLIDGSGAAPTLSAADTLAGHAGWSEVTAYAGSRKQWSPAASGPVAVNAVAMTFVFSAPATLGGLFIASAASGASGVLWCTAPFAAGRAVNKDQSFRLVYRLRAAAGGVRP